MRLVDYFSHILINFLKEESGVLLAGRCWRNTFGGRPVAGNAAWPQQWSEQSCWRAGLAVSVGVMRNCKAGYPQKVKNAPSRVFNAGFFVTT